MDVGETLQTRAVHVQICGPIAVDDAGERLEGSLPGRQGRLLFAYLVVHRAQPTPRAELVDLLWPCGGPENTDGALNALLSRLRRVLGADRVQGKGTVRLALADATIDLEAAEEAIHRAESAVAQQQWERAWAAAQVSLFTARRGFLPGEDTPWIDEVRRHLEQLHLRALEAYAAAALGLGRTELAAARDAARTLVKAAPLRESGHRLLMRALAAEGNPAEALRVYDNLRSDLRDELGVSPSAETRALYERLLREPATSNAKPDE